MSEQRLEGDAVLINHNQDALCAMFAYVFMKKNLFENGNNCDFTDLHGFVCVFH